MIWRRGRLELEVDWDHGPDLNLVWYGRRTHIASVSYVAYPVLGGTKPAETSLRSDEVLPGVTAEAYAINTFRDLYEAMDAFANDPINAPWRDLTYQDLGWPTHVGSSEPHPFDRGPLNVCRVCGFTRHHGEEVPPAG